MDIYMCVCIIHDISDNTDQPQCTFQDGCDDSGQQAASIDGQVEDGEEGASLLLLQDTGG